MKRARIPVALTIAGSDSGGGAGIQADLKTFAALRVHGTSAITCITAQNPKRVVAIQPCSPRIVRQQIEAVFSELPPRAVKTGMLFSASIIRVVAEFFEGTNRPPLIVDPVMVATSGKQLMKTSAVAVLRSNLLPLATLVTPNLDEAQILSGLHIKSPEEMRQAARRIRERFGCAALVKGGHLRGCRDAIDIFYNGQTELLLKAPFVRGLPTHGTGCTYSAAIAAYLARGHRLAQAVELAKRYITQAISRSVYIAGHSILRHLP
ncbi:MAG: bifunctional hydroxymethylpyrimidine kinase/phosphomethylpyrimidine kinase [Verrucomicrobia bacterium]|nr:bifunctional hydroxymethylpyrimidine kinase/phosphomethylpyrimidine kinase [Verrucomicrobiota bacterium]